MASRKEHCIELLERQVKGALSKEIRNLDEIQIIAISDFLSSVLDKERAGLDKFFGSISQTLKYLPNFLILAMTSKYIEPSIAARITENLPFKQSVAIAKGLSAEYIGETVVFMNSESAASLLFALPTKNIKAITKFMFEPHMLKVLDIFEFASDKSFRLVSLPQKVLLIDDEEALSKPRLRVLNKFRSC